jgi:hypothetical protein
MFQNALHISQEIQAYAEVGPKAHYDCMLYYQWFAGD